MTDTVARRTALILGVSGQDGALLARFLLDKGYRVLGTTRGNSAPNLARLGIRDRVELRQVLLGQKGSVEQVIHDAAPDEVYNLAGQSSVGLSFDLPLETLESTCTGTLNVLEAIRRTDARIRLFNAGSAECFGDTRGLAADEGTPFRPGSPYAVGKAAATWLASTYRDAHGLFAATGILFNHESPLRPERFVTQKIVRTACRIAAGSGERLRLGNIEVARDWGWAPEYVEAMWLMLQQAAPADFVLATGETHPLSDFIREVFAALGLDWREHVESDPGLLRPTDIPSSVANPRRAREFLGWEARTKMAGVARKMVDAERERVTRTPDPKDEGIE